LQRVLFDYSYGVHIPGISKLNSGAGRFHAPPSIHFLAGHVLQEQEEFPANQKGKKLSSAREEDLHHEYLHENCIHEEPLGLQPIASSLYDGIDDKGRGQRCRGQACQIERRSG
jgi:hypothetical protein